MVAHSAPKMFCFAKTISLATRVALAVALNSVGHYVFYATLFSRLGITSLYHTDRVFKILDKQTQYWKDHSKKASVKRARASRKQELWHEELKKQVVDTRKGLCYSQGGALKGVKTRSRILQSCSQSFLWVS